MNIAAWPEHEPPLILIGRSKAQNSFLAKDPIKPTHDWTCVLHQATLLRGTESKCSLPVSLLMNPTVLGDILFLH